MTATPRGARRAFSLVELLVVIGTVALLASLLLPVLANAREAARTVKCLSNLRQLGQANSMYVAQSNGWAVPGLMGNNLPPENRIWWHRNDAWRRNINLPEWAGDNVDTDPTPDGLRCPSAGEPNPNDLGSDLGLLAHNYGYNIRHLNYEPKPLIVTLPIASEWGRNTEFAGIKAGRVRNPAEKIQFIDSRTHFVEPQHSNHYLRVEGYHDGDASWTTPRAVVLCAYRHSRDREGDGARINIVFWDGHAATMRRGEVAAVRTPEEPAHIDGPVENRTPAWNRHWELGVN